MLILDSVDQVEHEADLPINGRIGSKELLNLKGRHQVKDFGEDTEDVLHESVVVLGDQTVLALVLDVVSHRARVDQQDKVDGRQVHACVPCHYSVLTRGPQSVG